MLQPDIITNIYFYKTNENGRQTPTTPNQFGCIFIVNEKKYDCRLILNNIGSISPGEHRNNIPIKFLCPELVLPMLKKGTKFYLWDMRNIAEGVVEKIINTKNDNRYLY